MDGCSSAKNIGLKGKNTHLKLFTDENDNVEDLIIYDNDQKLSLSLGKNLGIVKGMVRFNKEKKEIIQFKYYANSTETDNKHLEFLSMDPDFDIKLSLNICSFSENLEGFNNNIKISDAVKISVEIRPERDIILNYFRFDLHHPFKTPLDFVWVPHLRPKSDYIIGDHKFWAPVMILAKNGNNISLISDVNDIPSDRSYRLHMDMNQKDEKRISYGFRNYKPHSHVMFRSTKRMKTRFKKNTPEDLKLNFWIRIGTNEKNSDLLSSINQFLWNRFMHSCIAENDVQTYPFELFSEFAFSRIFNPDGYNAFRKFQYNGRECGGLIYRCWTGRSKGKYKIVKLEKLEDFIKNPVYDNAAFRFLQEHILNSKRLTQIIGKGAQIFPIENNVWFWNQAWFLNVRTAYGLRYLGEILGENDFIHKADRIINLGIAAPINQELFPSIAIMTDEGLKWIEGMLAFTPLHLYNIVDIALTSFWLLKYSQDYGYETGEIIPRMNRVADRIITFQLDSGGFPTLIEVTKKENQILYTPVEHILYDSAGAGAIGLFLCELYKNKKNPKILESAELIAQFLQKEIIPSNKWYDYETFYSCTQYLSKYSKENLRDPYTNALPNNNMCIYWAAKFLLSLYNISEKTQYLELGIYVLDYLCLFQQIWNPHFLNANLFGGFGCQNTDAEWSDARQALFATLLLDYYLETKNMIYLERGIAALKASFVLLLHKKNVIVAKGNFKWIKEDDYGILMENYAHQGYDVPVPGICTPDWGVGTANVAFAHFQKKIGDLCICLVNKNVFGVNACSVHRFNFLDDMLHIDIEILPEKRSLLIKLIKDVNLPLMLSTIILTFRNLDKVVEIEVNSTQFTYDIQF